MNYHVIETRIRYLSTQEGGRRTAMKSGYRGQFYYDGEDFDGSQYFPDIGTEEFVQPGQEVRAFVRFCEDRWKQVHKHKLHEGRTFQVREGVRVVGEGVVLCLDVPAEELRTVMAAMSDTLRQLHHDTHEDSPETP